jgi:transcriptional regulator with XRE-family HTH domain
MKTNDNEKQLKEESIFNLLENQYQEATNKEEIDYWTPLSKIIMESIELRDSKQMSQADLAEKMKTRQSVISRFENMGRLPNYDFISRLSSALEHKLGMTLYGDYMAVVPIDKQDLIKEMANKEKKTTEKFIQDLLEYSIEIRSSFSINSKMIYATSQEGFEQNIKQEDTKKLLLTSNDTNIKNSIAMAT